MMRRTQFVPRRSLCGLLALALAGCATNPATGGRMLSLISESQEIEMGRNYAQQVEASMPMYENADVQSYVERIGLELAAVSERPTLPWSFKVVDDASVNAFALPGGFIYVTRGILTHFNSEAALAAVLGHEIGHVTARHSVEQLSRAQLGGLLLGVGSIVSEDVRRFGGVAQAGLGLLFLSHSRDDEHQADLLGVRYAVRDRYDPREAIGVHAMLQRQTEARGGRGVPNWLATHPSSADRIERIRAQVDTIPPAVLADTRVRRDEFLAKLEGMAYGQDPRQGFFQGSRFVHPDLAFRFDLPDRWEKANLTQAVIAQSPEEDAIVQLTLAGSGGHAQAARQFFQLEGVRARGNPARQSVNGHPATVGRFEAATQSGPVGGLVAFIDYGGRTYRILGYTPAQRYETYENTFRRVIGSFDRLTDQAVLRVQPLRIQVLTVQRATNLGAMVASRPAPIPADELALLNGIDLNTPLQPGDKVKWVVGEPPPTGS